MLESPGVLLPGDSAPELCQLILRGCCCEHLVRQQSTKEPSNPSFACFLMAQSSRGAHEEPFVGRSRRPNRNATQRREQANRATVRFLNRLLRMASLTHRGFTVGGELAELAARLGRAPGMPPVSRLRGPSSSNESACGKTFLKRSGRQSWTEKERTRRGSAWIKNESRRNGWCSSGNARSKSGSAWIRSASRRS